ncbi:tRNA (adenosine(37)-N6)-threonylcarbamoyltransferase complex transferase subunit TsaD, partial [Candidatus Dojkabacteria bacterium]|nr:tRNA (adenosine(37)-N6)-threonylcarbamoyltransferase complex transferase subunit TsaD [Candidatus Dojkabacteria bacterium]
WVRDICASFQEAVVDVLVYKTLTAAHSLGIDTITVGGGVAANTRLRDKLIREAHKMEYDVHFPDFEFCLDNGAMIAGLGYHVLENS